MVRGLSVSRLCKILTDLHRTDYDRGGVVRYLTLSTQRDGREEPESFVSAQFRQRNVPKPGCTPLHYCVQVGHLTMMLRPRVGLTRRVRGVDFLLQLCISLRVCEEKVEHARHGQGSGI